MMAIIHEKYHLDRVMLNAHVLNLISINQDTLELPFLVLHLVYTSLSG